MNARESQLVHDVLVAWGAHPRVRIARINTGKGFPPNSRQLVTFGVPGTADIVGLVAPTGRMVQIECKTLTGRQRDKQKVMERVVTAMGGAYCLARSVGDVDRFFAAMGVTR